MEWLKQLVGHGRRESTNQVNAADCRLAGQLDAIQELLRALRIKLRFGELSRRPLQLLRFQMQAGRVECEWVARGCDQWDDASPLTTRERSATLQTIQDAIAIRGWIFRAVPDVESAELRIYRQTGDAPPELVMTGTVTRDEPCVRTLSIAMRAKLYGFRFWLDNGILEPLRG